MSNLIEIRDVSVSFGGVKAVQHASFNVPEKQVTSLIGPNGAGKTTLFNLVSGATKVDSGEIFYRGVRIDKLHPHQIAHLGLIRTFQGAKVIKRMTVVENMLLAAQRNPGDHLWSLPFVGKRKRFEAAAKERSLDLLEQVGLTKLADDYAGILSGGQRKLLDLARAMMAQPQALLLDEPFAGVNPKLVETLVEVLQQLRKEHELTILLVEHDLETVMAISDKVVVMAQGTPIAEGIPNSIYENEAVIEAYLGSRRGSAS